MNKRQKIEKLEHELLVAESKIARLEGTINAYDKKFDKMAELKDSTPADCKRGEWCRTCQFARVFFNPCGGPAVYICSKGESCGNYVRKKCN